MEELIVDLEYIKERVALVELAKDDPESAHIVQDDLWYSVLVAIAEGTENASELARAALQVIDIDYPRWHA